MKKILVMITLVLSLFGTSCTVPETNKIFNAYAPSTPEYKHELTRVFLNEGTKNLTFYFNELVSLNNQNYMKVDVSGAGTNAQAFVLVTNWQKLEGIKRTKGVSFKGAELKNLQLDIAYLNNEPIFTYRNLDSIID